MEQILQKQYGFQVDRDTIQRYAARFVDEVADRHGVQIADCTLSINFLSLLFGVATVEELKVEFSDELVMRLYESEGRHTDATIDLHLPVASASRTNLIEDRNGELEVDDGRLELTFDPFEIKTIAIRLAS